MAFNVHSLALIIALAEAEGWPKPWSIVCMGYPDVLIAPELVRKRFGLTGKLQIREDSVAVLAWHGLKLAEDAAPEVVESTWLLEQLGFQPFYLDIHQARGGEILQDMNEGLTGLAAEAAGTFDIVYDAGGMEHYFNVGQAVKNILDLAKVGGIIYHGNPHIACNHGFYNFCPTFYWDFYRQNGHEFVMPPQLLVSGVPVGGVQWSGRYRMQHVTETWIQVLVKKMHGKRAKWPTQSKYVQNPSLQGRLN